MTAQLNQEHDYGDTDCWCSPEVKVICPRCEPDPGEKVVGETRQEVIDAMAEDADPGCWRCEGTGVCGDATEWERQEHGVLIIHHNLTLDKED